MRMVLLLSVNRLGIWMKAVTTMTRSQPPTRVLISKSCHHIPLPVLIHINSFAAVGQMPFLDYLLDKNPIRRIGPPNLGNITRISLEHLRARLEGKDTNYDPNVPDFLQYFIESKKAHPDLVNDGTIVGYVLVNLLAGADTIAITIRAIFWYALHNTEVYEKLEEEILTTDMEDIVSFKSARALPCELCSNVLINSLD